MELIQNNLKSFSQPSLTISSASNILEFLKSDRDDDLRKW